ncbi:MAG TPA: peptide-methionine (S)-S-oxide reductase MsrA [Steroidobacteraceae bacterium]
MVSKITRMAVLLVLSIGAAGCGMVSAASPLLPMPATDEAPAPGAGLRTAVLAGGCFWGIQDVFQHVKGVVSATSGYAGGTAATAHYEIVSSGTTEHAESVRITYDPTKISYGQLLRVFLAVGHDPTELDRQGPDIGVQYRSVIFYRDPEQQRVAEAYLAQLRDAKSFARPIVTRVTPLKTFYEAEGYHQDYARRHPSDLYIVYNDAPKVEHLQKEFPALYQ